MQRRFLFFLFLIKSFSQTKSEPKKAKTQEELDQEKKRVEELIKKRKQEREEEERREQIEREKSRRKTGNEIVQIREKMEHEERIRAAQEMRRDRVEREQQRKKILEEIKRDREQMKQQSTNGDSTPTRPVTLASQFQSSSSGTSPSYDSCRLAIRLPNGSNLLQTFQANEQLCAVRLFVQLNRKDIEPEVARQSRFNLMMPPNRTFTDEDMEKSLKDLGLCPSSRIIITDRKEIV